MCVRRPRSRSETGRSVSSLPPAANAGSSPKGLIEQGQTAGETALQEAWEEAGLVGSLHSEPVGSFVYEKWCGPCHVTVFRMDVTESAREWPERSYRDRLWLAPAAALERIDDAGLIDIIRRTFALDELVPV
jgi:8-oxo-dGTP pyrophosphatase MutT (NUDIX family)